MQLHVDRLKDTPSGFQFEPDPGWWEEAQAVMPELTPPVPEPIRIEGEAYRMGEDVYLEGRLTGQVELGCGRCLERYCHVLSEPFRLVLEPVGDRVPAEPQMAEALARSGVGLSDELEAGWFRGPVLDLGAYFREVVALALPFQPLCREACKGLCPRCGADRNRTACGCAETRPHSPFAALEVLRGGRRNESDQGDPDGGT